MPRIYETKWFRRHFGRERTDNKLITFGANQTDIDTAMREVLAELENEWEIKSIVPIIASIQYSPATHGGVHPGYITLPYTDGILIVCQRSFEISEEELAVRKQAAIEKKDRENRMKRAAAILTESIEVRKALLGRTKYVWRGIEFDTEAEALRRRDEEADAQQKGSKKT